MILLLTWITYGNGWIFLLNKKLKMYQRDIFNQIRIIKYCLTNIIRKKKIQEVVTDFHSLFFSLGFNSQRETLHGSILFPFSFLERNCTWFYLVSLCLSLPRERNKHAPQFSNKVYLYLPTPFPLSWKPVTKTRYYSHF